MGMKNILDFLKDLNGYFSYKRIIGFVCLVCAIILAFILVFQTDSMNDKIQLIYAFLGVAATGTVTSLFEKHNEENK